MVSSDDALDVGMRTAETQTELIDESSPSSVAEAGMEVQVINELAPTVENNIKSNLNITSTRGNKDLRCIDDDALSGRRILFPPETPETNL